MLAVEGVMPLLEAILGAFLFLAGAAQWVCAVTVWAVIGALMEP